MVYSKAAVDFKKVSGDMKTVWGADAKTRSKILSQALHRGQTDFGTVLLCYLVQDFQAAPTKTKFFAIYDAYFTDDVDRVLQAMTKKKMEVPTIGNRTKFKLPYDVSCNYNFTFTQLFRLGEMAQTVELLSDMAKNKNFLDRILTSNQRKIPGDIFDDIVGEFVGFRGKDTLAEEMGSTTKTEPAFEDLASILANKITQPDPYFEKNLKTGKTTFADALKKAGFDTKKVGLLDMAV